VQNAFVESFNGTLRNECLNEHWFISLADAKRLVEDWRFDYNHHRPHSSLGDQTPAEFAILHSPWGVQTEPINNNLTTESSHND
jgi:putative transposase